MSGARPAYAALRQVGRQQWPRWARRAHSRLNDYVPIVESGMHCVRAGLNQAL